MPKVLISCVLLLALAAPARISARQKSAVDLDNSCHHFVQSFYDWYVPKTQFDQHHKATPLPMEQALKVRGRSFSLALRRRLRENSATRANPPGELVGLDFDPFLNSQDPSERFVAETVHKGGSYRVEVYGMSSGRRQEQVVPELILGDGRWIFVNFHYGKDKYGGEGNLLSILETLRKERQKLSH